jgi:hypothetical protein
MLPRLDRTSQRPGVRRDKPGCPPGPLLLRAAALVLGSGAAGLCANALRPAGVAILSFDPPTTCTDEPDSRQQHPPSRHEPAIAEIAPREASFLCGRAGVIFADTRPASVFAEGHVADAIHLPCDATELGAQAAMARLSHA